jgi:hypothetical protein
MGTKRKSGGNEAEIGQNFENAQCAMKTHGIQKEKFCAKTRFPGKHEIGK